MELNMELVLSFSLLAKIVVFVVASGVLAMMCLLPVNDRPTGPAQVVVWLALEAAFFALMFGFITIKFS
jgi:hypothetical protein